MSMSRGGWQCDPAVWRQLPDDLGTGWRYVGFDRREEISVPDDAGVYVMCCCPAGLRFPPTERSGSLFANLLTPVYVGKSKNLHRRFLEHCRHPSSRIAEARDCFGRSMSFWFRRIAVDRIDREEAVLIKCFGPPANRREETVPATLGDPIRIGVQRHAPTSRNHHL